MSVPCFIYTLQLFIKDSLFEDNRIKLILAKIQKFVCNFSHTSKASEMLEKIQVDFDHAQTIKKAQLAVQDVDTSWNSTYLMLERLIKIKSSVRYYVAN